MEDKPLSQTESPVKDDGEAYVVDELIKKLQNAHPSSKEKSHQFFKTTRVDSCSHVVLKKGVAQAVPYIPGKKKDEKAKQMFNESLARDNFKVRPNMHAGMTKKPLVPYNPNSYRNRLPIPDAKKPPTNASSIEFGDRTTADRKHFKTNSQNTYGYLATKDPVTNTGILAERTKWHKYLQNK